MLSIRYNGLQIHITVTQGTLQVAFRLVSLTLINHIEVLALCGPNPELPEIERFAVQCWKTGIDALHSAEQCYPRNLPISINLDSETLGYCIDTL